MSGNSFILVSGTSYRSIENNVKLRANENLSSFKILFGRPYETVGINNDNLEHLENHYLQEYTIFLGKQLEKVHTQVSETQVKSLDHKVYSLNPGDWVYTKNFSDDFLQEKWDGSYQVLLTTFINCQDPRTTFLDPLFQNKEGTCRVESGSYKTFTTEIPEI